MSLAYDSPEIPRSPSLHLLCLIMEFFSHRHKLKGLQSWVFSDPKFTLRNKQDDYPQHFSKFDFSGLKELFHLNVHCTGRA